MPLVVDASAIVPLALADEDAAFATTVLIAIANDPPALVPSLFWYELANVLVVCERRGRIAAEAVDRFLARVEETIPIETAPLPRRLDVIHLARQHNLSVYDASYLELSLRTGSPLASHDEKLRAALLAAGGELFVP